MFIRNYPLAQITSLGVGGPADLFVRPASIQEIVEAQRYAIKHALSLTVIGYGTNLLVRDGGIRGIVMQLAEPFAKARVNGSQLTATTGCLLSSLSKLALHNSLGGLEFAVGIPGGLGGAVFMNAGAYNGEIGPLIKEIHFVQNGSVGCWKSSDFSFSYRSSRLQKESSTTIATSVVLELIPEQRQTIKKTMNSLQEQRRSKQPLEYPSAGSTFKRPAGHYVGPLIEQAGLKGLRIGGAQISTKHAGFLSKIGDAKAQDFLDLIAYIQNRIQHQYGVILEPEIRIIGED